MGLSFGSEVPAILSSSCGTYQQLSGLVHCIPFSRREVEGCQTHALADAVAGMRVEKECHSTDTYGHRGQVWW